MTDNLSPGEARTRTRNRREIIMYIAAGLVGGVIGALVIIADKGNGDLFNGNWDKLVLDPAMAIVLAIAIVIGIIIMPIWAFTVSDELVRERNYIGYTGGGMAVMGLVPAWAVLHAGGLVTEPTAYGAWAIGFLVTMGTFAVAWLRTL